jgi:Raf kinase inhibitor-like YbhB/YbcL family protein
MRMHLGNLTISSPSFQPGERIPEHHVSGKPTSPPLTWSDVPQGTQSFALVVHDPDAPLTYGFTHWVIYGIPGDVTGLAEGAVDGFVKGANTLGNGDYLPPSPPPGHGDHHYYFELYALDADLNLAPGLTRAELLEQIDDHIIEQARIVGTYSN